MNEERDALIKLLSIQKKRMRLLQEKQALQGISTPPEVTIEIDYIKERICDLENQIDNIDDFVERKEIDLKYYVYVSIDKLYMIYSQFQSLLNIDFEKEIYSVLRRTIRCLDENGYIGTIEERTPYFRAEIEMCFRPIDQRDLVLFYGKYKNMIVGLGGSFHNTIGFNKIPGIQYISQSAAYFITHALWIEDTKSVAEGMADWEVSMLSNALCRIEWLTEFDISTPKQRFEVVAKRFFVEVGNEKEVLLGSPIYVALID